MTNLDASIFSRKDIYLLKEFEFILTQIFACYQMMLVDYPKIENDENRIRNRLYRDYLKKAATKETLGLGNYIFHPEIHEIDEHYQESARTDLMVYNCLSYLKDENAYYVIECKRIDGSADLNKKYVLNGVNRFIDGKYPLHKNTNGMIGFVVKAIDISSNTMKISGMNAYAFIPGFSFSFTSNHNTVGGTPFQLYHLMLDFSTLT